MDAYCDIFMVHAYTSYSERNEFLDSHGTVIESGHDRFVPETLLCIRGHSKNGGQGVHILNDRLPDLWCAVIRYLRNCEHLLL